MKVTIENASMSRGKLDELIDAFQAINYDLKLELVNVKVDTNELRGNMKTDRHIDDLIEDELS